MIKNKNKFLFYLLIIPIYLLCIYMFSQQTGDASNHISKGILRSFAEFLNKYVGLGLNDNSSFDTLNLIFRKLLHFSEYFFLAVLLYGMLKLFSVSSSVRFFLTFSIAVLYSASDEIHQIFVPKRTARITDVFIDSTGILLGAVLMYYFEKRKSARQA
ncbi:MAG: VanZ family protein [Bacillota bacterium]|nr:VanZ family protein [Bacillota bacterium]